MKGESFCFPPPPSEGSVQMDGRYNIGFFFFFEKRYYTTVVEELKSDRTPQDKNYFGSTLFYVQHNNKRNWKNEDYVVGIDIYVTVTDTWSIDTDLKDTEKIKPFTPIA